jgi:transketolase
MHELDQKALDIRKKIIKTAMTAGEAGHITSSFSCLDILVALYFGGILRYDPADPGMSNRDRFVLSKGHGAIGIYNVLCEAGFFQREKLNTYCNPGSIFGGHPMPIIPGVECATGALGHGLSFAVGIALAAQIKKADYLTYVVTGDGECQEGSVWEAAMSISQFKLTNLIWIIDYNKIQLEGALGRIMELIPLDEKLRAFGFHTVILDGHNYSELLAALAVKRDVPPQKPLAIIAKTCKGRGAPLFENKLGWHGRKPTQEEYATILEQLDVLRKEGDKS